MPTLENPSAGWIGDAREIVADLFDPQPVIYWVDFLGSFIVGGICYAMVRRVEPWWGQLAFFLVACFAFYRAVLFTHELTRLRRGTFRIESFGISCAGYRSFCRRIRIIRTSLIIEPRITAPSGTVNTCRWPMGRQAESSRISYSALSSR